MPQRTFLLVETILGILAVSALLLAGFDAARLAARGSGKRRRILEAGLAALLLLGIWPSATFAEEKPPAEPPKPAPLPAGSLDPEDRELAKALGPIVEDRADWKELLALRRELRAALPVEKSRGPGGLPQETKIVEKIERAGRLAQALGSAGALSPAALSWLRADFEELARIARRLSAPPAPDSSAEAEETPAAANLRFLRESRALLEEVVLRGSLRPQMAEDLLQALKPRVACLSEAKIEFGLTVEQKNEARALRAPIQAIAEALQKPEAVPLERDPRWLRFVEIWEAAKNAGSKAAPWPEAKAEWEALLASLDEAVRLVEALAAAGRMGAAETKLLVEEFEPAAKKVREQYAAIQRNKQSDPKSAGPAPSCYSAAPGAPTEQDLTLERLAKRLDLLEKLASQDRLRPEVLRRVLGKFEEDLEFLARSPKHRDADAVKRAKALLAKIKAK
jgi:hypothetical protein